MTYGRRDLSGNVRKFELEFLGDYELVLKHPGVMELRETVIVFVQVLISFVEHLVLDLEAAIILVNDIEIERDQLILERIILTLDDV